MACRSATWQHDRRTCSRSGWPRVSRCLRRTDRPSRRLHIRTEFCTAHDSAHRSSASRCGIARRTHWNRERRQRSARISERWRRPACGLDRVGAIAVHFAHALSRTIRYFFDNSSYTARTNRSCPPGHSVAYSADTFIASTCSTVLPARTSFCTRPRTA